MISHATTYTVSCDFQSPEGDRCSSIERHTRDGHSLSSAWWHAQGQGWTKARDPDTKRMIHLCPEHANAKAT